ncbi:OsmC family protein [Leptospira kanakyensis]|uniref:OsmC family protein n=1 Tax=Leptospira kanakyensis TaxID=2484968 RepID=UPI00223CABB2|nr:hypothetical protein [Leptospira kanakyensis]MCW7469559.1 OsmC family protein [Leptospira kanakyensis]
MSIYFGRACSVLTNLEETNGEYFKGLSDVRPGFSEIRYRVNIESDSPKSNIDALLEHIYKVCPVKDSLSGVPVFNKQEVAAS